jgi:6-phosphofructokinase 1
MGGTILGSINKGDTLARIDEVLAGYRALALDALIGVGGDGSLAILHHLAQAGNWQFIGIPKTIDNDVALTERVVGFDTAVNTITDALNRLIFTAASHDRIMIVEVMGREAGHLALQAGIAGGADVILIPEIPFTIQGICDHVAELREDGRRKFAIIVVAEGIRTAADSRTETPNIKPSCGAGQYLAEEMSRCSVDPIDVRVSTLGHIQRGGIPSSQDRLLASLFGKFAVDLIAQGNSQQMVAWQCGRVVAMPLAQVVAQSPCLVNPANDLVPTACALEVYVGNG